MLSKFNLAYQLMTKNHLLKTLLFVVLLINCHATHEETILTTCYTFFKMNCNINYIQTLISHPTRQRVEVITSYSKTLWLVTKTVEGKEYSKELEMAKETQKPVTLYFNPETREITAVGVTHIVSIYFLEETSEGVSIAVLPIRASRFTLRKIHPHYNQLYKRLWWAQKCHWFGVKVAIANGLLGVEDVQWVRMFKPTSVGVL